MGTHTIELYSPTGDLLADISELCTSRRYTLRRNRPDNINLGLNLEKAQQLADELGVTFHQLYTAGRNDICISRGSRVVSCGRLAFSNPGLDVDSANSTLLANGFQSLFSHRFLLEDDINNGVDKHRVTSTKTGKTAWHFINLVQLRDGGDFGVTEGSTDVGEVSTDDWKILASSIEEILIGLTDNTDAIDLEFTALKDTDNKLVKVFNAHYPGIGTDKTELLFSYPGNIKSIGAPVDATTLANYIVSRGSGNGLSQTVEPVFDQDSIDTYGRYERIDEYPAISDSATLIAKGQEQLRLYGRPTLIPPITLDGSMEPFLGSYWMGDTVRFSIDTDRYPAFTVLDGQTFRINEISVVIDEDDHEDITLKVGYA